MDNLLSYCELADPRVSTSEKDLPAHKGHIKSEECKISSIQEIWVANCFVVASF